MGRGVKPHFADPFQTEYCPTFHCPCVRAFVTGVTSHISHIYKGINAMLIIRGPIKPCIFWIKIILAIFLAKTRPDKTRTGKEEDIWRMWNIVEGIKKEKNKECKIETGLFDKGQTQNCAKWVKFWAADPKAEHVGKGRVAMTGEEALSVGREEQTWQPHITHSQPLVTRVIKCWPGLGLPTKEKLAWKRFFQHLQSK